MPLIKSICLGWLCCCLLYLPHTGHSQYLPHDTTAAPSPDKTKLLVLGGGFTVGYSALLITLNKSWYQNQQRTSFHFFNDNSQWKQMDKAGHLWSAFHESRTGIDLLRWAGVPDKKAIVYGGLLGVVLQTPIEIFDGYQADYGASVGDLVANTLGSAAVVAQELAWREVRIMPKYSFSPSPFAATRPNVLGHNLAEQALKDYNGQTYWLSVNIGTFLKAETRFPRWLNLAAGYGADEMVFNHTRSNLTAGFDAHRQYYLSPDLNLMHFKGRSKVWNTALYLLSVIKVPAPALEYNRKSGFRMHALHF